MEHYLDNECKQKQTHLKRKQVLCKYMEILVVLVYISV